MRSMGNQSEPSERPVFSEFRVSSCDWRAIQIARPNLLVIGSDTDVASFLRALSHIFRQPATSIRAPGLALPSRGGGTLVVSDVAGLSRHEQDRLLAWLAENGDTTQVISTSASAVFAAVETGTFLESLYYRLNVMTLVLDRFVDQPEQPFSRPSEAAG
jgi:hypothetical protein